jgi:N-acetylneuraminic acid mutarotase
MTTKTRLTHGTLFPFMLLLLLPLLLAACGNWTIEIAASSPPRPTSSSSPASNTPRPTVTPLGMQSTSATGPSQTPVDVAAIKTQTTQDVIAQLTASVPTATSLTREPLIAPTSTRLVDTSIPPTAIPRPTNTLIPPTSTLVPPSKLSVNVTPGTALQFPRTRHTATRLLNGKILIVGGSRASDDHLAEVELFDPLTGLSTLVAPLHTPRHQHTATLLPDGRVLIVGGYSLPQQWLSDAEVYDPIADAWTVVPPQHSHGVEHTANLMKDGRVLVVGGCIGSGVCTDRVDIFDYQANVWSEALPLPSDRASHTAQLLNDGRVLVAGGGRSIDNVPLGSDALLYDPQMNSWAAAAPMVTMRLQAQAVRLPDGRVLVTGGLDTENPSNPVLTASTEVYDPISNTWTSAGNLSQARYQHNLVLLADGQVLAVGGVRDEESHWTESSFIREIERYDPATGRWSIIGNLSLPRVYATATLVSDGRVWVTGGRYMETYWSDTWLIGMPTP